MRTVKGKTALVTGASSGIGEAIARRLARDGANLVLVARSESKLHALADTLATQNGITATGIVADLAQPGCGKTLYNQIEAKRLTIDILVNNAGFGTYGPFERADPVKEQQEIAVNVAAVVDLTHAFLPPMLQRRDGAILNLASTAAFQPGPYLAVYAATKAFVLSFSEALWAEYRKRGVHVVALCPGAVDTPFFDVLGDPAARQTVAMSHPLSANFVATAAIQALLGSHPSRIVGARNWLLAQSVRLAPREFVARTAASVLRAPRSYTAV